MSLISRQEVAAAAAVAYLTEQQEKKWIPPDLKIPFFGKYDIWMYDAVLDSKLCDLCLEFEKTPRYLGNELRSNFPYLEVVDANTIKANVHPNFRCVLHRIVDWSLDDLKWFVSYIGG